MKFIFSFRRHSAEFARNRVRQLLLSERIEASPQTMRMLKHDLLHTIKKYTNVEEDKAQIHIHYDTAVLHFEVPVRK